MATNDIFCRPVDKHPKIPDVHPQSRIRNLQHPLEKLFFGQKFQFLYISIRQSSLISLYSSAFSAQAFSGVKYLDLAENGIQVIQDDAFIRLGDLMQLCLMRNRISDLQNFTFSGLHKLTYLSVSSNQLTFVGDKTWVGLKSLVTLDLFNNKIAAVSKGTFESLHMLENLDLAKNCLQTLQPNSFRGLVKLIDLQLHANKIHAIEPGTFKELPNLRRLMLAENKLRNLSEGTFGSWVIRV